MNNTFKDHNSFRHKVKKGGTEQSALSRKPKRKTIIEMPKTNKFQLTTKNEYKIIKQDIYQKIGELNHDFGFDFSAFIQNTLKMSVVSINEEKKHVSLITSFYKSNAKLNKLFEITSYQKYQVTYNDKSQLYLNRMQIMEKTHSLLPQLMSPTALDTIQKYVHLGFNATYSIQKLEACLDNISFDLIDEYQKAITEYNKTRDNSIVEQPKFTFMTKLLEVLVLFHTQIISGFKAAYMVYKQYLSLIVTTNHMVTGITPMYYKCKISEYLMSFEISLHPSDVEVFTQLFRVTVVGAIPNDMFPLPRFLGEQYHQYLTYIDEIKHLTYINIMVSEMYKIHHNLFSNLPLSFTINKKTKDFFGKQISKNTYSILLNYLGNVNRTLTIQTLAFFETLKKEINTDN